jgi:hypothetical protein
MDPQEELEASRRSRRRAWENLQEIRWVIKDLTGTELPPPAQKTIDLEARLVKDGIKKVIRDRQESLTELVHAIKEYRRLTDETPLTLRGGDYAQAVQDLTRAIEKAEGLMH